MEPPQIALPDDLSELESHLAEAKRVAGILASLAGLDRHQIGQQLGLLPPWPTDPDFSNDDTPASGTMHPLDPDPLLDRLLDLIYLNCDNAQMNNFHILLVRSRSQVKEKIVPISRLRIVLGRFASEVDQMRVDISERLGIPLTDEQRKFRDPFAPPKPGVRIRRVAESYVVSHDGREDILTEEQGTFILAVFRAGGRIALTSEIRNGHEILRYTRFDQLLKAAPDRVSRMIESEAGKGYWVKPEHLA